MKELMPRRRLLANCLFILRIAVSYRMLSLLKPFLSFDTYQRKLKHLHRKYADLFFKNALRFKGGLIKVGQFISTRVDVMPVEYTDRLSLLQDRVPPLPYERIKQQIIWELERSPEEIFASFEKEPIASASLGQVHRAVLPSGEEAAVKVQYPDMDKVIQADLKALRFALRFLKVHAPNINLENIYLEFSHILKEELDYINEAHNAERMAENFADREDILIPSVYWEYTTKKVLALQFMPGEKITDFSRSQPLSKEKKRIADLLSKAYCQQFFHDRFFHGDPHPANILIQDKGKIVFVDFGICREISPDLSARLKRFARATISYDTREMALATKKLGVVSSEEDLRKLERLIEEMIELFGQMSPREFKGAGVLKISRERFHKFAHSASSLQIPSDLILVGRTMGILEGLSAELDPRVNIVEVAKPYISEFISSDEGWRDFLGQAKALGKTTLLIPKYLDKFLKKAISGDLEVIIKEKSLEKSAIKMTKMGQLITLALLAVFSSSLWFVLYLLNFQKEALFLSILSVAFLLLFLLALLRSYSEGSSQ